jgi:hypothetical protein
MGAIENSLYRSWVIHSWWLWCLGRSLQFLKWAGMFVIQHLPQWLQCLQFRGTYMQLFKWLDGYKSSQSWPQICTMTSILLINGLDNCTMWILGAKDVSYIVSSISQAPELTYDCILINFIGGNVDLLHFMYQLPNWTELVLPSPFCLASSRMLVKQAKCSGTVGQWCAA